MTDIVDSVLSARTDAELAALTSMHDLVVTPRPYPDEPPIEVVVIRSPSSGEVGPGGVLIEHRSLTGHDDRVFRPSSEAVNLFWQFMRLKFGVERPRTIDQPE